LKQLPNFEIDRNNAIAYLNNIVQQIRLWQNTSYNSANVEIEARLGKFSLNERLSENQDRILFFDRDNYNGRFNAGIDKKDFEMFKCLLNSEKSKTKKDSKECTYIYEDGLRVVWNGRKCTSAIRKIKSDSLELNIVMPSSFEYDIRLSVSLEQPLPPPPEPYRNSKIIRNKNRITYEVFGDPWKTDLTEVIEDNDNNNIKYEVEIEFMDFRSLISNNTGNLNNVLGNFWDTLCIYSMATQEMKKINITSM